MNMYIYIHIYIYIYIYIYMKIYIYIYIYIYMYERHAEEGERLLASAPLVISLHDYGARAGNAHLLGDI